MKAIGIQATTLTPFAYHSLMVQSGTATLPEVISDRAIAFGLASTLGMLSNRVALPEKNYKAHLAAMPYCCSVFITETPALLPPLTRRLNLGEEGGYDEKIRRITSKGNLKDFFYTQEVPHDQTFQGVLWGKDGFDPFEVTGQNELVIRIGLHRNGMVRLRKAPVSQTRLNAWTASLFGQELPMNRYLLHTIQLTPWMTPDEAGEKVALWS
ncbi:MAG: hypothetical protein HQM12_24065 [SAR324 cluster bacterium]|nr:hypothetical protein [SAR324 cluster bacterium]